MTRPPWEPHPIAKSGRLSTKADFVYSASSADLVGVGQIELFFGERLSGYGSLGYGWAEAEPHHVWATGLKSTLVLPAFKPCAEGHRIVVTLDPPPGDRAQILSIVFNSVYVGEYRILPNQTIEFYLGKEDNCHGLNSLEIIPLFCVSPSSLGFNNDERELSFCLKKFSITEVSLGTRENVLQADEPDDAQLLMKFESLGDDCEFGFVQRSVGAEPLSLLRFSGLLLHRLYEGLGNRFDGIDEVMELGTSIQGGEGHGEYMIVQNRYRYLYHTFVNSWDMDRDALIAREATRLAFCRRKLLEDLEDGEKIFVVKSSQPYGLRLDQVLPVAERVASYGGGTTFWVTASDAEHPPGTLQWHGSTLLEGRIDRLCDPGHAIRFSPLWVPLCRKAYLEIRTRARVITS